jgi:hypothetical protein
MGGEMARGLWLQDEATRHVVVSDPRLQSEQGPAFPGGTFFSGGWKTADGQLLDDQAAQALVPAGKEPWEWLSSNLTPVSTGVPGTMYPEWARLETMGFAAIGLTSIGASFLVVRRRRPL